MADFFIRNIIAVYFFYGLAFFSMGLVVLLESNRSSELDFAKALRPLAGFGLIHGGHEWFEMFLTIHQHTTETSTYFPIGLLRLILLAVSFLCLTAFGATLITGPTQTSLRWRKMATVIVIWLLGILWIALKQPNVENRMLDLDV